MNLGNIYSNVVQPQNPSVLFNQNQLIQLNKNLKKSEPIKKPQKKPVQIKNVKQNQVVKPEPTIINPVKNPEPPLVTSRREPAVSKPPTIKNVYIISNIDMFGSYLPTLGTYVGGSVRYLDDLKKHYSNVKFVHIKNKTSLLAIRKPNPCDILFVQQLLFSDILPEDIINVKNKFGTQIVISIHDFCWFIEDNNINNPTNSVWEQGYLYQMSQINSKIIQLFDEAVAVIHPSEFTKKHYSRFFPTHNSILQPHNDIELNHSTRQIPNIENNTINIGNFQRLNTYKGKQNVELLFKKYNNTTYKGYRINFKIVGKNISEYDESNWQDEMRKHNFHCLLHLNKYGETYSYALSKSINSGLPILYNNIGAFKERIPNTEEEDKRHYVKVIEDESEYDNKEKLFEKFQEMLDYIILDSGTSSGDWSNSKNPIVYKDLYNYLFDTKDTNLDIFSFKKKYNEHNKMVIILTSTVNVDLNKICVFQKSKNSRLETYIKSIVRWLKNTQFNIVLVENSGYEFKELQYLVDKYENRFEIISFKESELTDAQYLIGDKSKGTSELFAINYAHANSKLIKSIAPTFIIKITARYFIPELEEYLDTYVLNDFDSLTQNDKDRCELVGCHSDNFSRVFDVNVVSAYGHVETDFKNRMLSYDSDKVLTCKTFFIEPTQRGGVDEIFYNI
jgi:hypothetical protein